MSEILALSGLLFLICPNHIHSIDYLNQQYLGFALVSLLISFKIYKKYSWAPALLFFYICITSIVGMMKPFLYWLDLDAGMLMGLQLLSLHAWLFCIFTVVPFLILTEQNINYLGWGLGFLGLIDSYILLLKWATGHLPWFLMNNPAIDNSFIACCIPGFLEIVMQSKAQKKVRAALWLIAPVLVCFIAKTSTGVLGVGVAFSCYFWARSSFKKKPFIYMTCFSLVCAGIAYRMQGEILFESMGRFPIWANSFRFWFQQSHSSQGPHIIPWVGANLGSFFMYGPSQQVDAAMKAKMTGLDVFFWMHNDWLQVLFETGYIGLALTITTYGIAVYRSLSRPILFASLVTFGAVSVTQMPLRHFPFALLLIFFLDRALSSSKESPA